MLGKKWFESKEDKWQAFEAEALPYRPDLYRTARWLTRDAPSAEELVQETMFQALRSFHLYKPGTNCKAWLMRILYNHNARRLRRDLRFQIVSDPDEVIVGSIPFEPAIPEKLQDEEVIDAIWRLPENYRNVLILADIEEFSYKEVASALDIPIGTVMSRLSRSRKILRIQLSEYARERGFNAVHSAKR